VSACYSDKIKAAQFVCSKPYRRELKKLIAGKPVESDNDASENAGRGINVNELNAEKMKITDAILVIQAKRLVLRRRELALLKEMDGV
jgi:hypothetical protein